MIELAQDFDVQANLALATSLKAKQVETNRNRYEIRLDAAPNARAILRSRTPRSETVHNGSPPPERTKRRHIQDGKLQGRPLRYTLTYSHAPKLCIHH